MTGSQPRLDAHTLQPFPMANSYVRLILHCVWSTKHRNMWIHQDWEEELWAYIGGIARNHEIHPVAIGGIENHIHALVEPPKGMTVPKLLEILKAPSSGWINRTNRIQEKFHWQDGYSAFTVSPSMMPTVTHYIHRQREHHQGISFEVEYKKLLQRHGVEFEEAYLLD